MPRHILPHAPDGARVGLFGGSFDPAHPGHVHVTHHALRALRLDRIWWLVSPGNPLKRNAPAGLQARMDRARSLIRDPRVTVTDLETRLGTRKTCDTIAALQAQYPRLNFVWIMGADNLAGFHHWENWRSIAARVPMAVIARPGARQPALGSVAARSLRGHRLPQADAASLALRPAPVWCFLTIPMRAISSSELRAKGHWPIL
ncbi:nicotinate-nucleotide adenylyltransferase [Roseibaca sp. Y0-43]|uniref:nicotinate-nucleotide adenylyltransferase n=1 Tax=Roseibaca sp. Y0-43 TaxID=2816854 RepID=UPI002105ED6C|nr:nicotinate-nucleotide adenylyltransferase [Roseibaca sp. Y0-43]